MYRMNKHERWDTATFRRLMTNVRNFCVSKQESEEVHTLSQEEVLDQIEVPMRDLSCTPAGTSKSSRRVLIEELTTPAPINAPAPRPAQMVIDEIEDTASPPSNTEMEHPTSFESLVNGTMFKMPELKKFIRILCNIALREGDVIIPQQLSPTPRNVVKKRPFVNKRVVELLGPEDTETLAVFDHPLESNEQGPGECL